MKKSIYILILIFLFQSLFPKNIFTGIYDIFQHNILKKENVIQNSIHLSKGWNWVSFPILNRNSEELIKTINVLKPIEDQTAFLRILDKNYNDQMWDCTMWTGFALNTLDSKIGYKIETVMDVNFSVTGQLLPENTQVDLVAGENWVGYFVKESMTIDEAFIDIWDHLIAVYSEEWAWDNSGIIPSESCILVYGKMYIIYIDQACSFVYGEGTPVSPEERGMTEGFYYVEASTYSPINIVDLDDSTVVEVGVFMDGECIGATQVEEFPLQILAFLSKNSRDSGEVTFEFYCEGSNYKPAQDYKVLKKETGQFVNTKINLRPYEFTTICFGNPPNPAEYTFSGNNSNSFNLSGERYNQSATISYSIPTDGNIELIIYNIRGQKVKTLVKGIQPAGAYNVIWEGRDENDLPVGNGIYLYKLQTPSQTYIRKCILLK